MFCCRFYGAVVCLLKASVFASKIVFFNPSSDLLLRMGLLALLLLLACVGDGQNVWSVTYSYWDVDCSTPVAMFSTVVPASSCVASVCSPCQ
jgi:hypothetical protein